MLLFKQLLSLKHNPHLLDNEKKRKYHLIKAISFELLILNIFLIGLSVYLKFNFIVYLLLFNVCCVSLNLVLLKKTNNLLLAAHIINIFCFLMITVSNLWLGGASTSTLDWFYISPIIATVTIGIPGLLLYGSLSGVMLLTMLTEYFVPFHFASTSSVNILMYVNPVFIFLLISTILYHLLIENKHYESLLREQNFLLSADKKKFHYLSHHDFLTNLPNRSFFQTRIQEMIEQARLEKSALTLFFMDLDGFKKINDHYGHEVGDMLLLQASKRLQTCFRDSDFVARLGGDEFTAIITHSLQDNISSALAERIKTEFAEPFLIKGSPLKCTISLGKASYPLEAHTMESLLRIADDSMYQHKKNKLEVSVS